MPRASTRPSQTAWPPLRTIDVLVNNAGIGLASIVEATPDATVREIFETNTFGVFACCRAIIPQMRKQGHGTIINVTSSVTIGIMPLVAISCRQQMRRGGIYGIAVP